MRRILKYILNLFFLSVYKTPHINDLFSFLFNNVLTRHTIFFQKFGLFLLKGTQCFSFNTVCLRKYILPNLGISLWHVQQSGTGVLPNSHDANLRLWRVSAFDIRLIHMRFRADNRTRGSQDQPHASSRLRDPVRRNYTARPEVYLAATQDAVIPAFVERKRPRDCTFQYRNSSEFRGNSYLRANRWILCMNPFLVEEIPFKGFSPRMFTIGLSREYIPNIFFRVRLLKGTLSFVRKEKGTPGWVLFKKIYPRSFARRVARVRAGTLEDFGMRIITSGSWGWSHKFAGAPCMPVEFAGRRCSPLSLFSPFKPLLSFFFSLPLILLLRGPPQTRNLPV